MALECEGRDDELPRLPLTGNARQVWLIAYRAYPDMTPEDQVRRLFQSWLPLFPGPIGEPEIVPVTAVDDSTAAAPPAIEFRSPTTFAQAEFDYAGPTADMRWPTYAARRRERKHAHCADPPVDAMPLAVYSPEALRGDEQLPERPPLLPPDPFDLGVRVDLPSFPAVLGVTTLLLGAAVLGMVVSSRGRRQ